jgi:hypothetical protein
MTSSKRGGIMFEIVKAIHEALHTESTWVFVICVALGGGLIAGSFAWIIDKGYKNAQKEAIERPAQRDRESPLSYPLVEFDFRPEGISPSMAPDYITKLWVKITNRGNSAIQDVRMQATEYTLENHNAIVAMSKFGGDARITRSIGPNGGASTPREIRELMPLLRLEKIGPREHGVSRPMPKNENFYALRFTFIDAGSRMRYAFYKVISAQPTYLLPDESPSWGWTKGSSQLADSIMRNWIEQPRKLILADQRLIFSSDPAEEYIPGGPTRQQ